MENLTTDSFKSKVFDYENNEKWNYIGTKPAIIKFGAEWCAPCKAIHPILENVSTEYSENVDIYTVDIDEQEELAAVFGIKSIPSILFIPLNGEPRMAVGGMSKENLVKVMKEVNIIGS